MTRRRNRRILLDIDGVARDFITPYLKVLNELTDGKFVHDHIHDWHFESLKTFGASAEAIEETFRRMGEPGSVGTHPLYDGAQEGVARLQEIADVYAVTAPLPGSRTWAHECEEWLLEHLQIKPSNVVHTSAKHICLGDLFIEDKAATLVKWRTETPYGTGVLFHRPHNRNDRSLWDGAMVESWPHLVRYVELHFGLRNVRDSERWP